MNKQIDLGNIGGFPLEEDTLDFMQTSYTSALSAIAKLCGDKVILFGVEIVAGNVTSGWISVNGELMPFIGGPVGAKVVITTASADALFENDVLHTVYFTKTATCGALGDFDFSELVPLLSLQNVWLPNDLKQKYVDNAYIAANFDADGYGVNKEKGWRILSKAIPAAAGKVFVNLDSTDGTFDTTGKNGGTKTEALTGAQQGSIKVKGKVDDISGGGGAVVMGELTINGTPIAKDGAADQAGNGTEVTIRLNNDAAAHNNLQPYFVILTLIKL